MKNYKFTFYASISMFLKCVLSKCVPVCILVFKTTFGGLRLDYASEYKILSSPLHERHIQNDVHTQISETVSSGKSYEEYWCARKLYLCLYLHESVSCQKVCVFYALILCKYSWHIYRFRTVCQVLLNSLLIFKWQIFAWRLTTSMPSFNPNCPLQCLS